MTTTEMDVTETTNNITSNTAHMPEGQETTDTGSSSLKSYAGKVGLAVSTLFAPSSATITTTTAPIAATTIAASSASAITAAEAAASFPVVVKLGAAGLGSAMLASCEKDEIDPNAIDYSTDNPKHREKFMSDVEDVTLGNGQGGIKYGMPFWNGKEYTLNPKPVINFDLAKQQLLIDSKGNSSGWVVGIGYTSGSINMTWKFTNNDLKNLSGEVDLTEEIFDKYLNNGSNPRETFVKKGSLGWVQYNTGKPIGDVFQVVTTITINPFYFGKSNN